MHRLGLFFLFAALGSGCGDDTSGTDAGHDGGTDAGPGADGGLDGGQDGGLPDGGSDAGPPPVSLVSGACVGPGAIDLADDGSRVAVVVEPCAGRRNVRVVDIDPRAEIDLVGPPDTTEIRFSPSARYLVFRTPPPPPIPLPSPFIMEVAAGAAPVRLSSNLVMEHRFAVVDGEERLVVIDVPAGTRRMFVRTSADDFATETPLTESPELTGNLSLLTPSGRNVVYLVSAPAYERVPTDAAAAPVGIAVSPTEYTLAPIGLGDTHGVGHDGISSIAWIAFDVREIVEIADGVAPDSRILEFPGGGDRFLYFIRNGNPSRRIRNTTQPLVELADANAEDIWLSPDGARLLYFSDGMIWSVPAAGGAAPVPLFDAGMGALYVHRLVFAPDSSEVAVSLETDTGVVRRAPVDRAGASEDLETAIGDVSSMHYDAAGRLLYLRGDELRLAAPGAPPVTVADAVTDLLVAAGTVVYRTDDGTLYLLP